MDIEFKLKEINRNLRNVLERQQENSNYTFRPKSDLKVLFDGKEEANLGQLNGKQLILAFGAMFKHRWYFAQRKFAFIFSEKETLTVKRNSTIPETFSHHPIPLPNDMPVVSKDEFRDYFRKFLSDPIDNMTVSDEITQNCWNWSLILVLELAGRVVYESNDNDEEHYVGMPTAIMAAMESGLISDEVMLSMLQGYTKGRKKAADKLLEKYMHYELECIVNNFFSEKQQATNLEEVENVAEDKADRLLLESLKTYFECTIEDQVNDLFVEVDKEDDHGNQTEDSNENQVKRNDEEVISDSDEESESEPEVNVKEEVVQSLRRLCCCLHGEYIDDSDEFELTQKSSDQVRREMMKRIWKLVFQEEYDFEDEGPRLFHGRRLLD